MKEANPYPEGDIDNYNSKVTFRESMTPSHQQLQATPMTSGTGGETPAFGLTPTNHALKSKIYDYTQDLELKIDEIETTPRQ